VNKLDEIFAFKRRDVERRRASRPLADVRAEAADAPPTRGFHRALTSAGRLALIAEVKKASPVTGVLREDFDPIAITRAYERAGAECLSVLTDEPYFQGSEEIFRSVRAATETPMLRKDFTVDEYDIYEARAMGADAVLLIVYGLTSSELVDFRQIAEGLGMDVLIESHSADEADRALAAGATLLGVNNRDLTTFEMSVEVGERILPSYVGRATLVGESALKSRSDVLRMQEAGAQAVLIGSAFSESPDVEASVRGLMGR
jgi:indole-3-glycerol phosphate synthase